MRVAFAMFDKDGDGQISVQEVHETMTSLGIKISLKEVKEIVKRVDTDREYMSSHISVHSELQFHKIKSRVKLESGAGCMAIDVSCM